MPADWLSMNEVQSAVKYERTLLYGQTQQKPVALLYVDPRKTECVIGWPVGTRSTDQSRTQGLGGHDLALFLDDWFNSFLTEYQFYATPNAICEFHCLTEGVTKTSQLKVPLKSDKVFDELAKARVLTSDRVMMLSLKVASVILELTFDISESVIQAACGLTEARMPALVPFFMKYHRNGDVRAESEITLKAFFEPSHYKDALNCFSPLSVIY